MGSGPQVVGDNTDRAVEEALGRQEAPSEDVQGRAGRGGGLLAASEAVAIVSAAALAGGGIGMLVGIALGAINPFALGGMGVAGGTGLVVVLARRPWWRRVFGG